MAGKLGQWFTSYHSGIPRLSTEHWRFLCVVPPPPVWTVVSECGCVGNKYMNIIVILIRLII